MRDRASKEEKTAKKNTRTECGTRTCKFYSVKIGFCERHNECQQQHQQQQRWFTKHKIAFQLKCCTHAHKFILCAKLHAHLGPHLGLAHITNKQTKNKWTNERTNELDDAQIKRFHLNAFCLKRACYMRMAHSLRFSHKSRIAFIYLFHFILWFFFLLFFLRFLSLRQKGERIVMISQMIKN